MLHEPLQMQLIPQHLRKYFTSLCLLFFFLGNVWVGLKELSLESVVLDGERALLSLAALDPRLGRLLAGVPFY